jgi:hypothetical protein
VRAPRGASAQRQCAEHPVQAVLHLPQVSHRLLLLPSETLTHERCPN